MAIAEQWKKFNIFNNLVNYAQLKQEENHFPTDFSSAVETTSDVIAESESYDACYGVWDSSRSLMAWRQKFAIKRLMTQHFSAFLIYSTSPRLQKNQLNLFIVY